MFVTAIGLLFGFQVIDLIRKLKDHKSVVGVMINFLLLFLAIVAYCSERHLNS